MHLLPSRTLPDKPGSPLTDWMTAHAATNNSTEHITPRTIRICEDIAVVPLLDGRGRTSRTVYTWERGGALIDPPALRQRPAPASAYAFRACATVTVPTDCGPHGSPYTLSSLHLPPCCDCASPTRNRASPTRNSPGGAPSSRREPRGWSNADKDLLLSTKCHSHQAHGPRLL